jgi:hypothetical protein
VKNTGPAYWLNSLHLFRCKACSLAGVGDKSLVPADGGKPSKQAKPELVNYAPVLAGGIDENDGY